MVKASDIEDKYPLVAEEAKNYRFALTDSLATIELRQTDAHTLEVLSSLLKVLEVQYKQRLEFRIYDRYAGAGLKAVPTADITRDVTDAELQAKEKQLQEKADAASA